MASALHCTVTTPESLVYDGPARSVVVPAGDGELGILAGHAPLVGRLGFGELRVARADGSDDRWFLADGFVEVLEDRVTVLAGSVQPVSELDLAAEEAALRALEPARPGIGSSAEEQERHDRRVELARSRRRVARWAGG